MNVQHQEKTTYQQKFPPKSIETKKSGFCVKVRQTVLVQTCEAK